MVLTTPDPFSQYSIASPTVMPVVYAPSKYPSRSRLGFGRSSITVVAVSSVGFNAAVNEKKSTLPN